VIEAPPAVLVLGAVIGMTYGILAVGLVLIYRSSKIINFAHGQIGAFGAAVLGVAVTKWHVSYWVMFPVAIALSGSIAALIELTVIRRLRDAPKLMSMVATLGASEVLLLLAVLVNGEAAAGSFFPQPPLPSFSVGALHVTPAYFGMLFLAPILVLGLAVFFRFSRFGLATRAAAANPEAARIDGVSVRRMSMLSWVIAGSVSAFTALLVLPTKGFVTGEALGSGLLLRALVAAVIARMVSLPIALAAGIGVGLVEQVLLFNYPQGGLVEAVLFGVILVALLLQKKVGSRSEDKGNWVAVQPWPPLSEALRAIPSIRYLGWSIGAGSLVIALLLPLVITNRASFVLVTIFGYTLVGLSVAIVTGLSGQLTLGQFALAGIGSVVSFVVSRDTGNFLLAAVVAGLVTAFVSVLIGLPALRIRGLMLAVITLSFALAAQSWLFSQTWVLGEGKDPGRPILGSFVFDTAKRYYYYALLGLVVGFVIARNIRAGGLGRRMLSVRDNEDGARAFGVSAVRTKLQAFALAGFLAGIGGSVYGHGLSLISSQAFPIRASLDLVAMTVIGGVGVLAGPLIGAFYILGVKEFIPLNNAGFAATAAGWLVLILFYPGGLAQALAPARVAVVTWLGRRAGVVDEPADDTEQAVVTRPLASTAIVRTIGREVPGDGPLLEVVGLTRRFGGLTAVSDVSFTLEAGETLGLIGPNGAGKTTLFEMLSGFTKPDSGTVSFGGRDITRLSPDARSRLGMIRSFQDAALFPTLTVLETVKLSLEGADPTRFGAALLGSQRAERRKEERARELVDLMGLDAFRGKQVVELSTGTRRITELACVVALEPTLLLLDEPGSGVAQRETEALGALLERLKTELKTTLIVIEHDIPFIMSISGRVIAMESGEIIADGSPHQVRTDPRVVESYLGGDARAIERSGAVAPTAGSDRCAARTRSGSPCSRRAGDQGLCTQHSAVLIGT
jgi:ABC-type branched-subunit amino acid transport system ATPase component/ABC-type branched-subunit amino acid transport system permease subunit